VTVEKVLTTDPLSAIARRHVRDLLAECVRQDVPMDAEVTVDSPALKPNRDSHAGHFPLSNIE
jgi:hypothetical protein